MRHLSFKFGKVKKENSLWHPLTTRLFLLLPPKTSSIGVLPSLALLLLFIFSYRHPHTHLFYIHPYSLQRLLSLLLISVSSEWGGGGCRPYTCPQINPAVWLGSTAAAPVIPAFLPPQNTEKIIKYHLILTEKADSWFPHCECPLVSNAGL